MLVLSIIFILLGLLIDKLIKKFSPCKHNMIVEKHIQHTTSQYPIRTSRCICSKCGYIDYNHPWTSIKKPES